MESNITPEEKDPWELHDRIFSEEHMYGFVERTAKKLGFTETLTALPLMKKISCRVQHGSLSCIDGTVPGQMCFRMNASISSWIFSCVKAFSA